MHAERAHAADEPVQHVDRGAGVAFAFGYRDAVSVTTIGAGAVTYIVGPVTGAALGAASGRELLGGRLYDYRRRAFPLRRMADTDDRLHADMLRQSQQPAQILLRSHSVAVEPVADLGPAAPQPERQGSQLDNDCGDGAVLNPDIALRAVGTDYNRQRGAF